MRQKGSFWNWYKMMGMTKALKCCQNLYQVVVCACPRANSDAGLTLTIFVTESKLFPGVSIIWMTVNNLKKYLRTHVLKCQLHVHSATSFFRSIRTQTFRRKWLMRRRRSTPNIQSLTHSNRQYTQHTAAAEIRYEVRLFVTRIPNRPTSTDMTHEAWQPSVQGRRCQP